MDSDGIVTALQRELKEKTETIEELRHAIEELNQTIEGLNLTINGLNKTIKDLAERLGMNSSNSSKPPSSDGYKKPKPKSLREPSGKKAGGQPGHPGAFLGAMPEPDEIIRHMPPVCRGCPRHAECINQACVSETRQTIDAVVEVKVTAHQTLAIFCPLYGKDQKGEFPENVKATVQYGTNLQALAVAMNTIGAVSVNRTHEILSSVFGIPLSTGTINNMVSRCAESLTGVIGDIRDKVASSPIAHFDETGTRVEGKTYWVHNASTTEYTYLSISGNRGQIGMEEGGVLPAFNGIAVHDCWMPYWKFLLIAHALCCAHLLRELIAAEERDPGQKWAADFKRLLLDMKAAKEKAIGMGEWRLDDEKLQEFDRLYDTIIKWGYMENPFFAAADNKRGRKKKGKTRALIERLDTYKASVCLFIYNFAVPFDNNLSERDLRMIKTKTKVSGCFRSLSGARNYLNIMSYVSTAKKQGFSAYEAIKQAVLGNPKFCLS